MRNERKRGTADFGDAKDLGKRDIAILVAFATALTLVWPFVIRLIGWIRAAVGI